MTDRIVFLDRVRRAAEQGHLPSRPELPAVAAPTLPDVDLIEHFIARCSEADGVVHPTPTAGVTAKVRTLAEAAGGGDALVWDEPAFDVRGVAEAAAATTRVLDGNAPKRGHVDHNRSYMEASIGVTGALAGLAESGSIVVVSAPGQSRMASLVPETHIVVLAASKISRSLTHFLMDNPAAVDAGANLVVITGPSRTGDIEQQINLGVHGPRHLHIVLVTDA